MVPQVCDVYAGYRSYNNKCYFYRTNEATWVNAEVFCNEIGGHIVSIEDQEEADFISDYILLYGYTHWLGFSDKVRGISFGILLF